MIDLDDEEDEDDEEESESLTQDKEDRKESDDKDKSGIINEIEDENDLPYEEKKISYTEYSGIIDTKADIIRIITSSILIRSFIHINEISKKVIYIPKFQLLRMIIFSIAIDMILFFCNMIYYFIFEGDNILFSNSVFPLDVYILSFIVLVGIYVSVSLFYIEIKFTDIVGNKKEEKLIKHTYRASRLEDDDIITDDDDSDDFEIPEDINITNVNNESINVDSVIEVPNSEKFESKLDLEKIKEMRRLASQSEFTEKINKELSSMDEKDKVNTEDVAYAKLDEDDNNTVNKLKPPKPPVPLGVPHGVKIETVKALSSVSEEEASSEDTNDNLEEINKQAQLIDSASDVL